MHNYIYPFTYQMEINLPITGLCFQDTIETFAIHVFHCDKCGFCCVGKREKFEHCDTCDIRVRLLFSV